MITTGIESVPTQWTEAREVPFFRMVRHLFPRSFVDGATVLLASYDDEVGDVTGEQTLAHTKTAQPVGSGDRRDNFDERSATGTVYDHLPPGRGPHDDEL